MSARAHDTRQPKKSPTASGLRRDWLAPALIFVSAFLLYANTLGHDYVLDDRIYTTENVYVQQGFSAFTDIWTKGSLVGFNGANDNNYRPLVLLNFMAETQLFGLNPHVNHFFNVLLFALSCALIYFLLRRVFPALNPVFPALMALLFAFHPVHAEVVANIKSRDEILCLLFALVCLLCVRRHADTSRPACYWTSVIAFGLCVLCKESGVTFVLVVPLLLYFFTDASIRKIAWLTVPYVVVVLVYLLVRRSVLDTITFDGLPVMNNSLMAAKTTADMLATNFVLLGKYVYLLVIPYPLSWDYSYNQIPIVSFGNVWAIAGLLLYMSMGIYVLLRLRRKDALVFAILVYLITLSVSSNLFVKIAATFAERFLYAPSLGFCIAVPLLLARILRKKTLYGAVGTVLLVFAVMLVTRNEAWKNNLTLFSAGALASPNSERAQAALANELRNQADKATDSRQRDAFVRQALAHFHAATEIYGGDADTWYNQGILYYQTGDRKTALAMYEKTLAVDPKYAKALDSIGLIYSAEKDYDSAIARFTQALAVSPRYADALMNLGAAYHNKGEYTKALDAYTRSLQLSPGNPVVLKNLANVYGVIGAGDFNKGDWATALGNFTEALKYDPGSASTMTNIGSVYVNMGDSAKAVEYYTKALSLDPGNLEAREYLSQISRAPRD